MILARLLFLVVAVLWVSEAAAGSKGERSMEARVALRQFREFYLSGDDAFALRDTNELPPDIDRAAEFATSIKAEGAWPDIDYNAPLSPGLPAGMHYIRMVAMTTRALQAGTAPAESKLLLAATHRAFAFWISHDFQSGNWWHNQIGTPKMIGLCALLLGDELQPTERAYTVGVSLARFPTDLTGQNRVWLAGNAAMRGLLLGDADLIAAAAAAIWSEVRVTTEEGVQPDFSFHQHGAQQQFGNYGKAFAVEIARWGVIFRGTPWQLPEDKIAVFRDYLLKGQNWVSWRGAMDISACGRQLMPGTPQEKAGVIARAMELAGIFDPDHAQKYHAFTVRNQKGATNELTGMRYFWRSDYMIERSADFMATLKLSSTRVVGGESMNQENLSGYHLADGTTYFYRTGNEYEDIFPLWDWSRLPGVTCAVTTLPAFRRAGVERDFVGGISDGPVGVAALDYSSDGVSARKAWFFSNEGVVCLGADIDGTTPTVETTVNQSWLRGPVLQVGGGRRGVVETGRAKLNSGESIEHDGWRYEFSEAAEVRLVAGPVTGNWRQVFDNAATPKKEITRDVFTLSIVHGGNPAGARYAYVVSPVGRCSSARILENSGDKQAVLLPAGQTGIVFWKAASMTVPEGRIVSVSSPCLLLVSRDEILVVDPTQKLTSLQLGYGEQTRTVEFPTGGLAGSAVKISLPL